MTYNEKLKTQILNAAHSAIKTAKLENNTLDPELDDLEIEENINEIAAAESVIELVEGLDKLKYDSDLQFIIQRAGRFGWPAILRRIERANK